MKSMFDILNFNLILCLVPLGVFFGAIAALHLRSAFRSWYSQHWILSALLGVAIGLKEYYYFGEPVVTWFLVFACLGIFIVYWLSYRVGPTLDRYLWRIRGTLIVSGLLIGFEGAKMLTDTLYHNYGDMPYQRLVGILSAVLFLIGAALMSSGVRYKSEDIQLESSRLFLILALIVVVPILGTLIGVIWRSQPLVVLLFLVIAIMEGWIRRDEER